VRYLVRFSFVALGVYLASAISSLSADLISYDEPIDYHALTGHVWHGFQAILLKQPSYTDIISNTEYYGQSGRILGWLFFFAHRFFLFGRGSFEQVTNTSLVDWHLTGFIFFSHLANITIFLSGCYVVHWIARKFGSTECWLATLFYLSLPVLVGHSLFNTKDIPAAVLYTAFTASVIRFASSQAKSNYLLIGLAGGALCNIKIPFLLPVLASIALVNLWIAESIDKDRLSIVKASAIQISLVIFFWFVLTPPAWLSPVEYVTNALQLFSNFDQGGGCTDLLGHQFCLGSSQLMTFVYLLGWPLVHLPLILLIGLGAYVLLGFKRLRASQSKNKSNLYEVDLLLLLQIFLIPLFAVAAGSNLYDADRHFLFIYPPLCILSARGLASLMESHGGKVRTLMRVLLSLFIGFLLVNNLMLSPYQYVYFNEAARIFANQNNTSLDYWAVSAREAVQQSILYGQLPLNPRVLSSSDFIEPPPFNYALRAMGASITDDKYAPSLHFQYRNPDQLRSVPKANQGEKCRLLHEVVRRQLLFSPLTLSKLYACKSTSHGGSV